jgi:hypothetical protein
MLSSLNAVTKNTSIVTPGLGRPSPDPGLGSPVELGGGHTGRLLDFPGIGKTLACEGITPEQAPPALLEIQPARSRGNEDLVEAWMRFQPGTRLQAIVAAQIIGDDEDIPAGIVRFDGFEQFNVAFGVTRGGTSGDFLAIAHPERPIHPGFFRPPTIIERRFDAVPIGRPARRRIKGAWHYWSQFVGADGRRPFGGRGVVGDDRGSFGTKSLSRGSLQLCVWRQRTLSRKRMRRTWLRLTGIPPS